MKKSEWVILIVVVVVFVIVVGGGGYVFYKDFFSKDEKPAPDTKDTTKPTNGATSTTVTPKVYVCQTAGPVNPFMLLKKGVKAKEVCLIQQYMNLYNAAKLTVDGEFGSLTEFAVKMYISNSGMTTLDNVEAVLERDFSSFKKLSY